MTKALACRPPTALWVQPAYRDLFRRLVVMLTLAAGLTLFTHATAAAQIVVDGNLTDGGWRSLGTSMGGPLTSSPGNEINALVAALDATNFYVGVAGTVTTGNRILVFIDSKPGGYNNGYFGRAASPRGVDNFNLGTTFDNGFFPDYVLVIGVDVGGKYTWELYTLSGVFGSGGGPNLYLGDQYDPAGDLRAQPLSGSTTSGFEARLSFTASGAGADLAINQTDIRLFALSISDAGHVANQFISRANPGDSAYGSGAISFGSLAPNPVSIGGSGLRINEIAYTGAGYQDREFVEIKNATGAPVNLDGFTLRLVNGMGGGAAIYRELDLPPYNLAPGAYYVVCGNPSQVPNCNLVIAPAINFIENALPSAAALVDQPSNTIVDTVSYGGNTGAPYTEGNGAGVANIGQIDGLSVARFPDGTDTNNNSVDFSPRCSTPGTANTSQNNGCPGGGPPPTGYPPPTGQPPPTWMPPSTPTPLPTLPVGCVNVLNNGDFESDGGWMFGDDPIPGKYTSLEKHGGLRGVQLGDPRTDGPPGGGGMDKVSYSSIRQKVMIPGNASIAQLRWWHIYRTDEQPDPHPWAMNDRQELILLSPNGMTVKILKRVRENNGGWTESLVDLTEFRGKTVYVYFNVFNDKSGARTWMFLDDVTLDVCYPPTPTPTMTPLATDTPTVTPTPTPTDTETPTPTFTPTPTEDELAFLADVLDWYDLYSPAFLGISGQVAAAITNSNLMDQDEWILATTDYIADLRDLIDQARAMVAPARFDEDWESVLAAIDVLEDALDDLEAAMAVADQGALAAVAADLQIADETIVTIIEALALLAPSGLVAPVSVAASAAVNGAANGEGASYIAPLLALAAGSTIPGVCDCRADTLACTDYETQGEAQACHDFCMAQVGLDVHNLDLDGDRIACEVLPPMLGAETAPAGALAPAIAPRAEGTRVPSATPIPGSAPCIELVTNGAFEISDAAWKLTTGAGAPVFATELTFNASRQALRLGLTQGANAASISAADQELSLPPNASSIVLSFRYYPLYDEEPGPGDLQYVDLYNTATGQFAGRALGAQLNDRTWLTMDYDLTALAGQTVSLVFAVNNDGEGGRTALYVDNVSVKACNFVELTTPEPPTSTPDLARTIRTPAPPADAATTTAGPTAAMVAPAWLTRVGAIGVLAGVLGAIGFVALVIMGVIRRES